MTATIVRTCFAHEVTWIMAWKVWSRLDNFLFEVVEDRALDGVTPDDLVAQGRFSSYVLLADEVTLTDPEATLLAVDLYHQPGRTFRLPPEQLSMVTINFDISNLSFFDVADKAGPDGVFRGFS
jgi:hypothetical protein